MSLSCVTSSFIALFVVVLMGILLYINRDRLRENWDVYRQGPYNTVRTGASPLAYYTKYLYRMPYMYPQSFPQSYPYPHDSYMTSAGMI